MLSSPPQATSNAPKQAQPVTGKPQQNGAPAAGLNASASVFVPGGVNSSPDTGQHPQQPRQQGSRGHSQGGPKGGGRGGGTRGGGGSNTGRGGGGGLSRALQEGATRDGPPQQSPPAHHSQHGRHHQQQQRRTGQQQQQQQQQQQAAPQQQQQQREEARDGTALSSSQQRPSTQDTQQQQQRQGGRSTGAALAEPEGDSHQGSGGGVGGRGASSQGGRGRQTANHLLNFQYDTRGPQRGGRGGRGGPGAYSGGRRRPPAYRPQRYDKDKFLQANFRFLVSSAVDTKQFDSDADRMFDWEDVLMVDMRAATPVQCPISLDSPPSCPQITPCGHVFSFGSIMRHLVTHGGEQLRRSAPCPLCYQPLVARELRLVQIHHVQPPAVGDTLTFQLLRRPKGSILPLPVAPEHPTATDTAAAGTQGPADTTSTAAGTADTPAAAISAVGSLDSATSSSSNAGKWAARKASAAAPAAPTAAGSVSSSVKPSYAAVSTPLSDNLFAKFATLSDPRPLWRAAARELGHQLAEVLAQGGMEADFEAPGLFAAADCLAHRARRFAEHTATQLLQRGVPIGAAPAAAPLLAAASSSQAAAAGGGLGAAAPAPASDWPVWLSGDPQAAGSEADGLIRDAFTVAIDSGKSALVAAEQEQQVAAEFPSLAATVGSPATGDAPAHSSRHNSKQQQGSGLPAAAAVAGGSGCQVGAAAKPAGSTSRQQQQAVQAPLTPESSSIERQPSRPELFFDHAFSEDEDDIQQQLQAPGDTPQPEQPDDNTGGTAVAAAAADGRGSSSGVGVGHSAARNIPGASDSAASGAAAAPVFGTSPGGGASSGLLGSSPTSTVMNSANLSGDYYMYQSDDGQWLFLHPLNLRCLLHAYGSYASCPPTVTGKVLELEDIVQDEGSRRRWKFLGHLPLHGTFRLGEVALTQPTLTPSQLAPLADELAAREKRRRRRAEAARRESRREAAAAAAAAKARQGPSAAELRSMPRLGEAAAAAAASGGGVGECSGVASMLPADLQGLSPEQLDEALAAQAMHDSTTDGAAGGDGGAAAYGTSPPPGGVSFARIAELGFAATGPALGSSPAGPSSSGAAAAGPAVGAAGGAAALKGAWGAGSSSGKSAAARLSGSPAGGSSSSSAAGVLNKSVWGAGSAAAAGGAARPAGSGSGAASGAEGGPGSQQWLVLGGGREGGVAEGGAEGGGATAAAATAAATTTTASSSGKKSKKGMILFATGQQRRY